MARAKYRIGDMVEIVNLDGPRSRDRSIWKGKKISIGYRFKIKKIEKCRGGECPEFRKYEGSYLYTTDKETFYFGFYEDELRLVVQPIENIYEEWIQHNL